MSGEPVRVLTGHLAIQQLLPRVYTPLDVIEEQLPDDVAMPMEETAEAPLDYFEGADYPVEEDVTIVNVIMQTAGHGLMGQEENSALDSTQTTVPCVVCESVKLSSHGVLPSAQIGGTEAPHLLALWARHKAARAGSCQVIHRNKTQAPCEYIHCTCSLCSRF